VDTPRKPSGESRSADPYLDMRARWCPSPTQDEQAAEALARHARQPAVDTVDTPDTGEAERGVYTVQVLVGKHHGVWTTDIDVLALPSVYWSRAAALGACTGAVLTHRRLRPDVPASASYCWHRRLATPVDPSRTDDGRQWRTHWSIFEDIVAAPDASDEGDGHGD
jgi:hypothetical protein